MFSPGGFAAFPAELPVATRRALDATKNARAHPSEKDTKVAQKLGQLQPFTAVFPQEYSRMWANVHLLGQPNSFLARAGRRRADRTDEQAQAPRCGILHEPCERTAKKAAGSAGRPAAPTPTRITVRGLPRARISAPVQRVPLVHRICMGAGAMLRCAAPEDGLTLEQALMRSPARARPCRRATSERPEVSPETLAVIYMMRRLRVAHRRLSIQGDRQRRPRVTSTA